MSTRIKILIAGAIVMVLAGWALLFVVLRADEPSVPVSQQTPSLQIEFADTPEKREQGLSGRTDIPSNYGMLFVFEEADRYGFWMKDMLIPIDIIWLSDEGAVLGIEEAVTPESYPDVLYPPSPVRYVLEVKAGEASRQGWEVGMPIVLPLQ